MQQEEQIKAAKEAGVEFLKLQEADQKEMVAKSEKVYADWGKKIGADYIALIQKNLRN
jgi:TRAP-type C4-dicarboxylate transport system substrate-binding protein